MKRLFLILLLGVLLALNPISISAQYAHTPPPEWSDAELLLTQPVQKSSEERVLNVGKTFIYTGLSAILAGVASTIASYATSESGIVELPAALGFYVGAPIALVGVPIYLLGRANAGPASPYDGSFTPEVGGMVSLSGGFPFIVGADARLGYNFNPNLFVGGGIGVRSYNEDLSGKWNVETVPIYANVRYSIGNKRVSPYVGASAGWDFKQTDPYAGVEFGTHFRKSSIWFGVAADFVGSEMNFTTIKLGKSF